MSGQVYFDRSNGHVHFGPNEGTSNTELWVTVLDVPLATLPRLDALSPANCPF